MTEFRHRVVNAAANDGVRNSQPEGIGRVVALRELVCWNNLGRNVVFADDQLRPLAIFGTTLYPGEDEASQYDLDVHAILDVPEFGLVVVLNHFGTVRAFPRADLLGHAHARPITPNSVWRFVADVERTIAVAGRLVGSAPRSDGACGLLVSDLLDAHPDRVTIPTKLCATAFGEVSGLGLVSSANDPLIAIGGNGELALVPFVDGEVGSPKWEAKVGFRVATIAWHNGQVFAAGPDSATDVDDYDWESLRGGGFAFLDPTDGSTIARGFLPDDVAWGTGGVAVAPFGSMLVVADRTGCVHSVDPASGTSRRSTRPLARTSLGIAHLAVVGRRVLCGFNRGGYRLHSFVDAAAEVDGP